VDTDRTLGRKVEAENKPLTLADRRSFMKLSMSERRRILSEQADVTEARYSENSDWKEFLRGDFIVYCQVNRSQPQAEAARPRYRGRPHVFASAEVIAALHQ
jgi:hypothetical protein